MFDELLLGNTIELRNKHPYKNEDSQFRAILNINPRINFTTVQIKSIPTGEKARDSVLQDLVRYLKRRVGGGIEIQGFNVNIIFESEPQFHLLRLQTSKTSNLGKVLLGLGLFSLATYVVVKYSPIYQEDIKSLIHRNCG